MILIAYNFTSKFLKCLIYRTMHFAYRAITEVVFITCDPTWQCLQSGCWFYRNLHGPKHLDNAINTEHYILIIACSQIQLFP